MSGYRGDIRLGDTIDVPFTTRNISGVPTSLLTSAGSPTGPTIVAFVGNSAVPISAGITLTADVGGIVGFNSVRVVASGGNGFATTSNIALVISNGLVNSVSVIGECIGGFSIEARSALMPTTAARTLDVSSSGEAGVDWANVGSPTTTVGLTNTTISTTQAITSVSGSVGSVTGAVGSVTGNVGGNVVGSVGSIATGGITSGSFAAGAINAAAIATGAIDADAIATDAVTEIQSGLATKANWNVIQQSEHFENSIWTQLNNTIDDNATTAPDGSLTADKSIEDLTTAQHGPQQFLSGTVTNQTYTFSIYVKAAGRGFAWISIANKAAQGATYYLNLSTGAITDVGGGGTPPYISSSATDAGNSWWRAAITYDMGTGGNTPHVSVRHATASGTNNFAGDGVSGLYLWGAQLETGTLTDYRPTPWPSFVEVVADIQTVTDKYDTLLQAGSPQLWTYTADALKLAPTGGAGSAPTAADVADAVWDEARAGHVTAGTFGEGVASVQGNVTGSVASVTGNVGGNVVGSVASVTGAVGSVTGNVGGNVVGSVASVTGAVGSVTGAVGSVTGNVGGNVVGSVGSVTGAVGSVAAGGITASSVATGAIDADALATDAVNEISDGVWDELLAGHVIAGSAGAALGAAGAAGDPWAVTLEGTYTASDLIRIMAAVAAGKSTIAVGSPTGGTVTFRDVTDASNILTATMVGSQRAAVVLAP